VTTPIRINCESTTKIPSFDKIRAMVDSDHHVVFQFPGRVDKHALISKLRSVFPEHSVFDSGGDGASDWVTVMPVIARAKVLAHAQEIRAAVKSYIEMCSGMQREYAGGSLSEEWSAETHGGHRRFENSCTGQVIEAPMEVAPEPSRVDPYFFALFAKSTLGLEVVARLLRHDFHDAARMLDILFGETGSAQPCAKPNGGPVTAPGDL